MNNKRTQVLGILFLITSANLCSQSTKKLRYPTHPVLQEADSLLCCQDTVLAIINLEAFLADENWWKEKRFEQQKHCKLFSCGSACKADVCLLISDLSLQMNDTEKSFKYLKLAEGKFFPDYGSLNGILMYKNKLSLCFADYYLKIKDEENAIARLLKRCLSTDKVHRAVAKKLKPLLLKHYTQKEISDEIFNGISNMIVNHPTSSDPRKTIEIDLFGVTVLLPPSYSIEKMKAHLNSSENVLFLTGTYTFKPTRLEGNIKN